MSSLVLCLLLAGLADHELTPEQRPAVVVVFEGSPEIRQRAASVAEELAAPYRDAALMAYDAEPGAAATRPRTGMRDAMEAAFAHLSAYPGRRVMIVVGHEQFYPSATSGRRLLDLARRTRTIVHTVYLSRRYDRHGFGASLNHLVRNRFVWFVEKFLTDERGYSPRDTARFLSRIAAATGGTGCAAAEDGGPADCVARLKHAVRLQ